MGDARADTIRATDWNSSTPIVARRRHMERLAEQHGISQKDINFAIEVTPTACSRTLSIRSSGNSSTRAKEEARLDPRTGGYAAPYGRVYRYGRAMQSESVNDRYCALGGVYPLRFLERRLHCHCAGGSD
jgi:hypothetical protein